MRLFLAVEAALAGPVEEAAEHLQHVVVRDGVVYDKQLLTLAKTLVAFRECALPERIERFKTLRRELAPHFSAWGLWRGMKDVRRTFRRAGKVFVHNGGGWRARIWFFWKLNWQWSLLPLAPVALALLAQPPVLLGLVIWRLFALRQQQRK